jgi:glycosyltransferase involved in cell wall biosynthesis
MACAKPVSATNASGHKDIITADNALMLNRLSAFLVNDASGKRIARWEEPSLDELIAKLDYAYHHRSAIQEMGRKAAEDLTRFTWSRSADRLIALIDGHEKADLHDLESIHETH